MLSINTDDADVVRCSMVICYLLLLWCSLACGLYSELGVPSNSGFKIFDTPNFQNHQLCRWIVSRFLCKPVLTHNGACALTTHSNQQPTATIMTDQSDVDRHDLIDRLETEEEKDDTDDLNPDDDVDDIDEDEEDVEMDTPNESGRDDDDDDDDDDGDVDVNMNDDINETEQAVDIEGDKIPMENNEATDGTANDIEATDTRRKGASGKPHPRKGPRSGGNQKANSRNSNGRNNNNSNSNISRTPSVRGLTIPFRTIKKSMKLDPDIPIVQNEAAIMATVAVELFLKRLVTLSHRNAKQRGRNTVRYEDVAEARTKDKALAFLETMLP